MKKIFTEKNRTLIFFTALGLIIGYILNHPLIWAAIGFFVGLQYHQWQEAKQTRYIPDHIKKAVLNRYFNMCAVCTETNLLEFHHKKEHAEGGDNSEKNIVSLCPKHHSMVRRLENVK